jgi:C4-dicarboxylate transporter, DctQ subunit
MISSTKVSRVFNKVLDVTAYVAAVLMFLIMAATCVEIISRYVFRHSILGIVDLTEYSLIGVGFLAAAWVLRKNGHVKMDLLLNKLPPIGQVILNTITSIIAAVICLIIIYFGVVTALDSFLTNYRFLKILNIPAYPIIGIVTFGFVLLFLELIRKILAYINELRNIRKQEQNINSTT